MIFACAIPISDVCSLVALYFGVLNMELLNEAGDKAYLRRGKCHLIFRCSDPVGMDTRVYFEIDSPYNTRRRLVNKDVEFVRKPGTTPLIRTHRSWIWTVISFMRWSAEWSSESENGKKKFGR